MRKRVRIALAVLVIAVLGLIVLAIISRPAPEPTYQGKTLSQWLVLLDSDPAHKAQNDESARAIESMGKQALPVLIHILQRRYLPIAFVALMALGVMLLPTHPKATGR